MKSFSVLAALMASSMLVSAGSVALTSIVDTAGNDVLITDNNVNLVSGFVGVGVFTGASDAQIDAWAASLDFASLLAPSSGFTALGSDNFVNGFTANLITPEPGMFFINSNYGTVDNSSALVNRTIYAFIGNGVTLATSTQFALIRSIHVVNVDSPLVDSNNIAWNQTTTLIGVAGTTSYSNPQLTNNNTISAKSIELIPEPSVALLGGLGVLGLVARRRRN